MKILIILALMPAFLVAGEYNIDEIKKNVETSSQLILNAVEVAVEGSSAFNFHFHCPNGSCNKEYVLITRNLMNREFIASESLKIDQLGKIVVLNNDKCLELSGEKAFPGESVMVYLFSKDLKEIGSTKIVHCPVISTGHGYKISIGMFDPSFLNYTFEVTGFEPDEEVTVVSRSAADVCQMKGKADVNGTLEGTISPAVEKGMSVLTKLEFTGKKGSVSIEYPLGRPVRNLI